MDLTEKFVIWVKTLLKLIESTQFNLQQDFSISLYIWEDSAFKTKLIVELLYEASYRGSSEYKVKASFLESAHFGKRSHNSNF